MKSFTIIELLISLMIFLLVLFALQGLFSSVWTTQFRALAMKKLADSTRTALEIMGREMRLAAGDGTGCTSTGDSFEVLGGGSEIRFFDFSPTPRCIAYRLNGTILEKEIDGVIQSFFGGASGEVVVDSLAFTMDPPPSSTQQPRVTINITVHTLDPASQGSQLAIELQTTISQRELNVP